MEHYNDVRLNSAIGYITPKDMLAGRQQEIHAERDRKLEEARKHALKLAELDRAKTKFFSNVSHEFRTPLTLMMAPLEEALMDQSLPSAHLSLLDMVFRNGQRLMKLVNALLDFSRIEAGRYARAFLSNPLS